MTTLIHIVFNGRTKSSFAAGVSISRLVQNEPHARVGPEMTQCSKRASGESDTISPISVIKLQTNNS